MKTYMKLQNDGAIDIEAFTLIGASTKRGDYGKIGFFGSGLKYALAVLIRNKVGLKVYSGMDEIQITTEEKDFRGQKFNNILINGTPTSLTSEMGIDWKPWFAIREIFCNALDEGGVIRDVVNENEIAPEAGKTTFYIELSEVFTELTSDWKRYFCNGREADILYEGDGYQVFEHLKEKPIVYRRGVQCYEGSTYGSRSLFDYNSQYAEINESRVLANEWEFRRATAKMLGACDSEKVIGRLLNDFHSSMSFDHSYEEANLSWANVERFSETWHEILKDRVIVIKEIAGYFSDEIDIIKDIMLPKDLVDQLVIAFPDLKLKGRVKNGNLVVEADETEKDVLERARELISKNVGEFNYPIVVCKFESDNQLGEATGDTIYIAQKCLRMNLRDVAMVILEELAHLRTGYGDKSRAFQTYIFGMVVDQMLSKEKKDKK